MRLSLSISKRISACSFIDPPGPDRAGLFTHFPRRVFLQWHDGSVKKVLKEALHATHSTVDWF